MKHILTLAFCLTYIACQSPSQGENQETIQPEREKTYYPKTNSVWSYYQGKDHTIGGYPIKATDGFTCNWVTDSFRYQIEEKYPGVLIYHRLYQEKDPVPSMDHIVDFYHVDRHQLQRRILLDTLNPYRKAGLKPLKTGGIDYEGMDIHMPDSSCQWPQLGPPAYFSTSVRIDNVTNTGTLCVSFFLLTLSAQQELIAWEQTLVLINREGDIVQSIPLRHTASSMTLTPDNTLLAIGYGGNGKQNENPFEPCTAHFALYNVPDAKLIIDYTIGDNCDGAEVRSEGDLIYHRLYNTQEKTTKQLVVNTTQKEIRIYTLRFNGAFLPDWEAYKEILRQSPFDKTNFNL